MKGFVADGQVVDGDMNVPDKKKRKDEHDGAYGFCCSPLRLDGEIADHGERLLICAAFGNDLP